jgi:phage terminase small subunit
MNSELVEIKKKLTPKEAKFVEEYLIDLNAAGAARRAGYSEKTATVIGYENLTKPHIQDALQVARQEISVKSGITPEMVLKARANIAFFDIAECYTQDGMLKNIHDIPKEARLALAGLESEELFTGRGADREQIGQTKKVKVWDKNKALDALDKHFGLYNADLSGQTNVKFIVVGTAGLTLDEAIIEVGVVEIESE